MESLQLPLLSLHSFALCYLSHRLGNTGIIVVSSLIVLFVPQVWNYKQHGCLFTHCVICPTGVELQAAWLSLHSLCYLSHRCGTTSSMAVSSFIVLFVPQVWNYRQHGCLFTQCVICPTGVELQAAPLSLHSAGTPGLHPYHLLPSCQCLLQSLLEYFSYLACLHALWVFHFLLELLALVFHFLGLFVLFSSVFFFLCCLFASELAFVYSCQQVKVMLRQIQNRTCALFFFSHSFGLLFFLIFHLLLASSSLKFLGFLYQFIIVITVSLSVYEKNCRSLYQYMKRTVDHCISV